MFPHEAIIERLIYYWAKLFSSQLQVAEDFTNLSAAYTICFINSRLFQQTPVDFLNQFEMVDRRTGVVLSNHFGLTIVELPKFTRRAEEIVTPLERWCYYFGHGALLDTEHLPETMNDLAIKKAMEVLMRMSQNAEERARYESREKFRRDMNQIQTDAANATEKGMQKGMEKGRHFGAITILQSILKVPQTPEQDLEKLSIDELQRLAEELQRQVIPGK